MEGVRRVCGWDRRVGEFEREQGGGAELSLSECLNM